MKLYILGADNSKDMENMSQELSLKKFKLLDEDDTFILLRRRRVGNVLIHAVCLIIALGYFAPLLFVNVAYFTYSYLWASPHVLITTEKVDDEGNPLEFTSMDEVLKKATSIL
ncbi:hypothetical protein [Methanobrevibacter sp.]|uniref:hypothetical protein n=1 Tax=Methanobrevibacter sp. TaxID=66852 RepID=UPI003868FCB0